MAKIFLDIGAHKANSLKKFVKTYEDAHEYRIFCFEPNPKLNKYFEKYLSDYDVTVINAVAWIKDGETEFFEAQASPIGSTLYKDKTTQRVSKTPTKVPSIDISRWIQENLNEDDFIILKMNIEGAEYDIVEKMLKDDTLKWANELYISWHFQKIPSIGQKRHKNLMKKLKDSHYEVKKWKAMPPPK